MNHLKNTVRKLTLTITWLSYNNNSGNFRTNSPTCNLPTTHTEELTQFTDRLKHLTVILQPHPTPWHKEEPVHTSMQAYTDTLHATHREANLTMSLLQDITMFNGQDSSKLEGWLMDLDTAADI